MASSSSSSSSFDRKKAVYTAKLAEEAERYEDMVETMRHLAKTVGELTTEERNLLSIGYRYVSVSRRASWRNLSVIERIEESRGNEVNIERINRYKQRVVTEMNDICYEVSALIDEHLIPSCKPQDHANIVFYLKMKGDYFRYLAEVESDREWISAASKSLKAYETANTIAAADLPTAHPIRLSLALNYSVFNYEILSLRKRACQFAQKAIDQAILELDSLSEEEFKDSVNIMHLLRENIEQWNSQISEDDEEEVGHRLRLDCMPAYTEYKQKSS